MSRNPAFAAPEFPPPTISSRLRDLAATISAAGLPAPRISVMWYECDDDTIRAIVAAFPDLPWRAHRGDGGNEWLEVRHDRLTVTVFDRSPVRVATPRLAALLTDEVTA